MNTAEFNRWLDHRGLSQRAAAPLFGVTQQAVNRWARGAPIPPWVARIIDLLDRIEAMERAADQLERGGGDGDGESVAG